MWIDKDGESSMYTLFRQTVEYRQLIGFSQRMDKRHSSVQPYVRRSARVLVLNGEKYERNLMTHPLPVRSLLWTAAPRDWLHSGLRNILVSPGGSGGLDDWPVRTPHALLPLFSSRCCVTCSALTHVSYNKDLWPRSRAEEVQTLVFKR